ncbi:MAG: MarR family transcriptional regulator [Chloroflexota bacterium]|nr:MarR family transcriptional regulator [Dehalococcoidia bacterium]MDW8252668.1 MarR family transcriptional regulator [Chloroflexota bacterium]
MIVDNALSLPAALLESDAYLLGRVRTRLIRRLAEEHAALGLRIGQGVILICLEELGPLSQRDLAQLLDVDPSDLVRHLDDLEAGGFVERRPDLSDRRRNLLVITAPGQMLRRRYEAMIARVEEEIFGVLEPDDRLTFRRLLRRLATAPAAADAAQMREAREGER